jgi:hypothetical protein
MKFFLTTMLVAATGVVCLAKEPGAVEMRYNPATSADVRGVVTEVHVVPAGKPLAGVHVTLKSKGEILDVYLAPPDFLSLLKTSVAVGDDIRAVGSRVNGDTILTKEFFKKGTSIVLRDPDGSPVWQNWGVAADPATISQ